jgi:Alpha 1,4-glycosyltransferase conserved region.
MSNITTASDPLLFTNRSLLGLGTNYVGAQSQEEIANGALNFDTDAAGRRPVHLCLMDVQKNFNGHLWTQNSPSVILRVLQILCGTNSVSVRPLNKCYNPLPSNSAFSKGTQKSFLL